MVTVSPARGMACTESKELKWENSLFYEALVLFNIIDSENVLLLYVGFS